MLLYTDILTGDEMFSDAFPVSVLPIVFPILADLRSIRSKEVDEIVYEVDCAMITVKGADIDIGRALA
jgi:hypothetical protein